MVHPAVAICLGAILGIMVAFAWQRTTTGKQRTTAVAAQITAAMTVGNAVSKKAPSFVLSTHEREA
jgi:hypothetical protein